MDRNIFGYVTKEPVDTENEQQFVYKPFLVKIDGEPSSVCNLELARTKQIMVQFLYHKQSILSDKQPDKLLVLIHQECKFLMTRTKTTCSFNFLPFLQVCFSIS